MSIYKGNNLISGAMPDAANQSLSNLDSAGQDIIDGKADTTLSNVSSIDSNSAVQTALDDKIDLDYSNANYQPVNKAGDTMTGRLVIDANSNTPIEVRGNIIYGTKSYQDIQVINSSSNRVGLLRFEDTGSVNRIALSPIQYGANTNVGGLQIQSNANGVISCTFPNTTSCDGQFVQVGSNIVTSSVSLNGSSNLSYTLSAIANKGYNHMALITAVISTGSASGNYCNLEITTDIMSSSAYIARVRTRTASTLTAAGSVWVPVSTSGKIYFYRSTNWAGTLDTLRFVGYRRIGTNS